MAWKRFRLLACLAVMLAVLGAGGFAWLRWGVPERPYGAWNTGKWVSFTSGLRSGFRKNLAPKKLDPFTHLERAFVTPTDEPAPVPMSMPSDLPQEPEDRQAGSLLEWEKQRKVIYGRGME
jgi:hypothetical protein